jgi:hypothetical protein
MTDISARLQTQRAAVEDLIAATEKSASIWTQSSAPGKWSPSQVVEHVARTLEESANAFSGQPTKFPNFPTPLRPVIRTLLFNRVVKNGKFPKAKTNKPMNPLAGPATVQEGRARLEQACATFDRECLARVEKGDQFTSSTFGPVSIADYVRFMEIHARHHRMQIPDA